MRTLISLMVIWITSTQAAEIPPVYFEPDTSVPLVYVNLVVRAGSAADPQGMSGITNFMGEMLLRGTRVRSKEQIDTYLDQIGASLEVEVRAESMIFRGATLKSELDGFLGLMAEILSQPSFPENEIRKLKNEMISGIAEELNRDSSLAVRRFQQLLYGPHPYGNQVLGKSKDIEGLSRGQIAKHYESLLNPQHLFFVGTGDATSEKFETWLKGLQPLLPKSGAALANLPPPPKLDKKRIVIIDKPDRTQTQIVSGHTGVLLTNPDYFNLYLGNAAFGGGSFHSRLMQEIRVKRGWSYGAGSGFRFGTRPRHWQLSLFPASKYTAEALQLTLDLVSSLQATGITEDEYALNKTSLINGAGFSYNTPKKRVENQILEVSLGLPEGFLKTTASKLAPITRDQVNASLKTFVKPDALLVVVVGTAAQIREPIAQILGIKPESIEVIPYQKEL